MTVVLEDELKLLRDTIRKFVTRELQPIERLVDERDEIPPEDYSRLRAKAAEMGLLGLAYPAEYGGSGLGVLAQCVAQAALRDVTVMTPRTRQAHAAVSVCLGEIEPAKASMKIYLEQRPGQTLEVERDNYLELWTAPGQLDRWLEAMRIAGMP